MVFTTTTLRRATGRNHVTSPFRFYEGGGDVLRVAGLMPAKPVAVVEMRMYPAQSIIFQTPVSTIV